MRTAFLILAILAASIAGLRAGDLPQASRIGVLAGGSEASSGGYLQGLQQGLTDLGLVDGKNVHLEIRYANGRTEPLDTIAVELARSGVDVIVAIGSDKVISAVKRATVKVPIVAVTCDAIAAGLVTNLAHPGGNMTGVTCISKDLAAKRVEFIKEAVPSLSRLGVLLNPGDKRTVSELTEAELAARSYQISSQKLDVTNPEEIAAAFSQAAENGIDGVSVDSMVAANRVKLADAAVRYRMPTIFAFREFVDAGGLLSYGPNLRDMCRQSARHVVKIIEGEAPGDIPMEQPTRFELVINLKTAKALGLSVPSTFLSRADDVIE